MKYEFYRRWYLPLNATVANVILCDPDLHFHGQNCKYSLSCSCRFYSTCTASAAELLLLLLLLLLVFMVRYFHSSCLCTLKLIWSMTQLYVTNALTVIPRLNPVDQAKFEPRSSSSYVSSILLDQPSCTAEVLDLHFQCLMFEISLLAVTPKQSTSNHTFCIHAHIEKGTCNNIPASLPTFMTFILWSNHENFIVFAVYNVAIGKGMLPNIFGLLILILC